MRFCDLGPLRVEVGDGSVDVKGRLGSILTTLLVHQNSRVSVDVLLDAVWPDATTAGSASTLETHVWRLRKLLEPDRGRGRTAQVLISDTGGYRLMTTVGQVDSARFEQLGLDVLNLIATGQPERALTAADEALALWRGEPYSALVDHPWAAAAVARLVETRTQLLERRVDALLAVGSPERALIELEGLLTLYPLRERLWWLRMLALHRSGRVDDALSAYQSARRVLREELGVDPGTELVELQQQILRRDSGLLSTSTSAGPAGSRSVELHLPRPRTMIGREVDLLKVTEALTSATLTTICGAAGCGKTLLATETARAQAPHHPDGVFFVDLVATDADVDIAAVIAAALDLTVPETVSPLSVLAEFVADRRALVVLDNCEHLIDELVAILEVLGEPAPQVDLLATSREPIGIPFEQVVWLEPLAVSPDVAAGGSVSTDEPAVQLFLARARLDAADATDLQHIRRICRSVDGIPLALELAAALVSTYTLAELADYLERDTGQLAAVGRGHARHHQTLSAAIEGSYRLLSDDEQQLHRRLSVLPGGFGRDLAVAVAGPDLGPTVTSLLAGLVHRSMLSASRRDGQTRFVQLAPIRNHAAHALYRQGELTLAQQLRDQWMVELVGARPKTGQLEEAAWHAALLTDLPTLRETLHRLLVAEPRRDGAAVAWQLVGFWYYQDRLEEGSRWAEAAMDQAGGTDLLGLMTRLGLATVLVMQGRADRSRSLLDDALALVHTDADGQLVVPGEGRALTEREELHLGQLLVGAAAGFSVVWDADAMRRPLILLDRAVIRRADPDIGLVVDAVNCLLEIVSGATAQTLSRAESVFARASAHQNLWAAWLAAGTASSIALSRRDPALGLIWSRRVIEQQGRLGARTMLAQVETYGDFLALDGQLVKAVHVFAATQHQARRVGRPWPRSRVTTELWERCRRELSTGTFTEAWAAGPGIDRRKLFD